MSTKIEWAEETWNPIAGNQVDGVLPLAHVEGTLPETRKETT